MTVHAVVSAEADHCALNAATLDKLQWEQFEHDELYHREIARLTVHDRWKHMALHFAKYAGTLAGAAENDGILQRTVVDTFIIALSTSNTLNIRASELYARWDRSTETAAEFLRSLTMSAGKMAAACEKLDHVEAFPFREEITTAIATLLGNCVSFASSRGWKLDDLARARLSGVKAKWIHHGR